MLGRRYALVAYALAVLAIVLSVTPSRAADTPRYPAKAVRMIVPVAPGGAANILARALAARLSSAWRQQVIVDNRPGAGGNLAFEAAARSAADGYTLLLAQPPLVVNVSLYRKLAYDPIRDLDPITLTASSTNALVAHPSIPARDLRELIDLAKRRPGQLTYASAGNGSTPHLSGEWFKHLARIDLVHIPYKGAGPAIIDLLGGHVALAFVTLTSVVPQIKANRLRALAITSGKRSPLAPEIGTFVEAGLREIEINGWYGVLAPAGTPRDVILRVNADVADALVHPEVAQVLAASGLETFAPNTPEEFAELLKRELARWARVVKIAGAKAD